MLLLERGIGLVPVIVVVCFVLWILKKINKKYDGG
jgi:hypothetical protein